MHRIWRPIYWLGLVFWISALVTAAVAASFSFVTLAGMDLVLSGYAPADGGHGHLVAGILMDRIFRFLDVAEMMAAAAVALSLAGMVGPRWRQRRITDLLCAAGVTVAIGLLVIRIAALAPAMRGHLQAYWDAARSDDAVGAATHQAAFRRHHPTASRLYGLTAVLLLATVIVSTSGECADPRHMGGEPS